MAIDRELFLKILEDAYTAYYSIVPAENDALPLAFRADYKATDEQYFLAKSANIWRNEKNEYTYVFSAPSVSKELAEKCIAWALEDMLPRVKPHKEHQYLSLIHI